MLEAKLFEQGVRKERDNATWANVFAELPHRSIFPNKGDDGTGAEATSYFAKMTGGKIEEYLATSNMAIWLQSMQKDLLTQVGEEMNQKAIWNGLIPTEVKRKMLRPTTGNICQHVLLGGGDIVTKTWASIHNSIHALAKWCSNVAFETQAAKHAIRK